ncbi:MAG: hypothetical protein AAGG75_06130 [Bacteroidota bacterium]
MTKLKQLLWINLLLLVAACTTIDYVGNSYTPTKKVDVFFDERDIDRDYEVIGKAIGEGVSMDGVKDKMIERAKREGADAVLIEGISSDMIAPDEVRKRIGASFLRYR